MAKQTQQTAAHPGAIMRRWDETRGAEMALARAWHVALSVDPTSPIVAALRELLTEAEAEHTEAIGAALTSVGVAAR